jgi:hypothetical protein
MAEDKPRGRTRPDTEPEIGSADLLFRDDPAVKPGNLTQKPGAAAGSGSGEVFDLVEDPESRDSTPTGSVPPIAGAPLQGETRKPREPRAERARDEHEPDPSQLVAEVWSRKAEWGPTLIVVGGWVTLVFLFVYFVTGVEHFGLTFLALILGGLVAVVLSYPILITLERPVRITPEQAVRDYYSALSHHLPHFRRMWLLLSSAGRISTAYGSFEGFKRYWRESLHRLRAGHAGRVTPLVFQIIEFDADKSAGKNRIDANFTLKVSVRGQRKAGAIHSVPMRIALVRGPDKMWYLENGTLTRSERAPDSASRSSPGPAG